MTDCVFFSVEKNVFLKTKNMGRYIHLRLLLFLAILLFFYGCTPKTTVLKTGIWRCYLAIDEKNPAHILPFFINIVRNDSDAIVGEIRNAEEKILLDSIWMVKDSIFMRTPLFDTEFKARIEGDKMTGVWMNYMRGKDYSIPFYADFGITERFPLYGNETPEADLSGKWQVTFGPETEDSWNAIGEFTQNGNKIKGTFLTETGDFRYLEGNIRGDEFLLSGFDGSHAFLFTAKIRDDYSLHGTFYSGKHWKTQWMGYKNPFAALRDPEKLTYLKPGYEGMAFCFPDLNGKPVCLSDEKYKNKVVLVQIMGTWCPNCMDETALYAQLYHDYASKGLEIIALAFEKSNDSTIVNKNIRRLIRQYAIGYNVLWAGESAKEEANKVLPMLNNIVSYPTTLFINRQGEIVKIYTGFMGPGTGQHYETLVMELRAFVEELLNE